MEQTCHISQGSEQEAETTVARKTENRELCADESIRSGGVTSRTHGTGPPMTQSKHGESGAPTSRTVKVKHTASCKTAGQPVAFLYVNSSTRGWEAQVEDGISQ